MSTPTPATLHVQSRKLADTLALGEAIGQLAEAGDIIGLIGQLGAGKTQLVRGLARGLGLDPHAVASPTFVLVHEYEPPRQADADADANALVLVHIDAYRLGSDRTRGQRGEASEEVSEAELEAIGWADELFEQAVVAVEWAELLRARLGGNWLEIAIAHAEAGRAVTLSAHGRWAPRIEALQAALDRAGLASTAPDDPHA